jgi:hypothetical protein
MCSTDPRKAGIVLTATGDWRPACRDAVATAWPLLPPMDDHRTLGETQVRLHGLPVNRVFIVEVTEAPLAIGSCAHCRLLRLGGTGRLSHDNSLVVSDPASVLQLSRCRDRILVNERRRTNYCGHK